MSDEHDASARRLALGASVDSRGIALIIVLWLTIMLTVIASGFAFSMRSEALSARNALSLAQARAAADGGVERIAFELSRPRMAGVVDGGRQSRTRGRKAT